MEPSKVPKVYPNRESQSSSQGIKCREEDFVELCSIDFWTWHGRQVISEGQYLLYNWIVKVWVADLQNGNAVEMHWSSFEWMAVPQTESRLILLTLSVILHLTTSYKAQNAWRPLVLWSAHASQTDTWVSARLIQTQFSSQIDYVLSWSNMKKVAAWYMIQKSVLEGPFLFRKPTTIVESSE